MGKKNNSYYVQLQSQIREIVNHIENIKQKKLIIVRNLENIRENKEGFENLIDENKIKL